MEYNDKCYLKISAVKLKEVQVESAFQKDQPYIMDLSFNKYDFQKGGEQIPGYSISEINIKNIKLLYIYIYIYKNGIVRIKFKYYY